MSDEADRGAAAAWRSRSPTACSAASARRRTSCRRRSSASTARCEEGERIESPRAYLADRGHPAGDRPAALGPRAARDLRRRVAARAAGRSRGRRPGPPRRDGRLAVAGVPACCSRACRPSSARSSCCARCSTTPTTQIAAIVGKSEANARQLASRARRHVEERAAALRAPRASSATSSPTASSPPRGGRPGRRSRTLLAEDVVLHGDGGGKAPALARPVAGASGWRARCWPGRARAALRRRDGAPRGGQRAAGRDHRWTARAGSST